jgi:hypothetical protein
MPIEEASAKVRTGPPIDDEEDYALPCWAGVVGLRTVVTHLEADPRLPAGTPPGPDLAAYVSGTDFGALLSANAVSPPPELVEGAGGDKGEQVLPPHNAEKGPPPPAPSRKGRGVPVLAESSR